MSATRATKGAVDKAPAPHRVEFDGIGRGVSEEDISRARFYGLLARLLAAPMTAETLSLVRGVEGDDSPLGRALSALAGVASKTTREAAEDEYSALFYGVGAGGEILPYASHYLTGFLYEKPLADLRGDLAKIGIEPSGASSEPEDHIAFLCEVMHGLIVGAYGDAADFARQKAFFGAHIEPWARRFFVDLEGAKATAVYMPVGTIGRIFIEIESEAFRMS